MLIEKLEPYNINVFINSQKIKNEQGIELDFKKHLFLYDIYQDLSPKQVILKAAQIGFSTLAIIKCLWIAKYKGMDIIYCLPTQADVYDFVGGKANRIIAQNPVLQSFVKDRDTFEQKRVGNNIIYFRGTWTEKAAIMVSSDLNIFDEEDRCKQDVIQQYASRLQHSKYKWEWHFSNPSVSGNGVDRYWKLSDQKHWMTKCPHCQEKQWLSWPESIDQEREIYICKKCGKELSDDDRRVGEWIAQAKGEYSGYWIPLLIAPWITAKEICNYKRTKSEEYFWNFVLGLPYIGSGNTVTPDIIYRNLTEQINYQESPVVIGCDSGLVKHYVLGNRQGIFYYGKTDKWEDIESYLKKYERSIAVIDALPDLTEPRKLRERYPGRVFLCHFSRDRKTMQLIRWGKGDEYGNVVADRNRVIQMIIDEFADRRIPLQGTIDDWSDYYSHWDDIYKTTELDALGVPQSVWNTKTGNDHWVFGTLYWRLGMDRIGSEGGGLLSGAMNITGVQEGIEIEPNRTATLPDTKQFFKKQEDDWRN